MRYSMLLVALSAFAAAQEGSSTVTQPENPATRFLTETNSLGVVTGQPTKVTSQPAVQTSEGGAASIPAGMTSAPVIPTASVPTGGGSSTFVTSKVSSGTGAGAGTTASGTEPTRKTGTETTAGSGSSGASGSASASASVSATTSSGLAPTGNAAPIGLSFGLAGAAIAAFL